MAMGANLRVVPALRRVVPSTPYGFSLMSHNVLVDCFRRPAHCAPETFENRFERLVEIYKSIRPCVLSLQELSKEAFEKVFLPRLRDAGYEGVLQKDKPDAKQSSKFVRMMFTAVFWRRDRFAFVSASHRSRAIVVWLADLAAHPSSELAPQICVASMHLEGDPLAADLRQSQLASVMRIISSSCQQPRTHKGKSRRAPHVNPSDGVVVDIATPAFDGDPQPVKLPIAPTPSPSLRDPAPLGVAEKEGTSDGAGGAEIEGGGIGESGANGASVRARSPPKLRAVGSVAAVFLTGDWNDSVEHGGLLADTLGSCATAIIDPTGTGDGCGVEGEGEGGAEGGTKALTREHSQSSPPNEPQASPTHADSSAATPTPSSSGASPPVVAAGGSSAGAAAAVARSDTNTPPAATNLFVVEMPLPSCLPSEASQPRFGLGLQPVPFPGCEMPTYAGSPTQVAANLAVVRQGAGPSDEAKLSPFTHGPINPSRVDHIFYSSCTVRVDACARIATPSMKQDMEKAGLPSLRMPSDHLPLLCSFEPVRSYYVAAASPHGVMDLFREGTVDWCDPTDEPAKAAAGCCNAEAVEQWAALKKMSRAELDAATLLNEEEMATVVDSINVKIKRLGVKAPPTAEELEEMKRVNEARHALLNVLSQEQIRFTKVYEEVAVKEARAAAKRRNDEEKSKEKVKGIGEKKMESKAEAKADARGGK